MKVKKIGEYLKENKGFTTGDFEYDYGDHIFVLARPIHCQYYVDNLRRDWSNSKEWRPCAITGVNQGQSIWIIGSQFSFNLKYFEIATIEVYDQWCRDFKLIADRYYLKKDADKYNL